jgi:hypothetical protein
VQGVRDCGEDPDEEKIIMWHWIVENRDNLFYVSPFFFCGLAVIAAGYAAVQGISKK